MVRRDGELSRSHGVKYRHRVVLLSLRQVAAAVAAVAVAANVRRSVRVRRHAGRPTTRRYHGLQRKRRDPTKFDFPSYAAQPNTYRVRLPSRPARRVLPPSVRPSVSTRRSERIPLLFFLVVSSPPSSRRPSSPVRLVPFA